MRIVSRYRKTASWIIIFSFIYFLQLSSMPLSAATDSQQKVNTQVKQVDTQVFEKEAQYEPVNRKRRSPILFILIGVVAVAAVVAVLLLIKKYDITGSWVLTETYPNDTSETYVFTFMGGKSSGTFVDDEGDGGTFSVDGKSVTFEYDDFDWTYSGEFTDRDNMKGSWVYNYDGENYTGTWQAVRGTDNNIAVQGKTRSSNSFKKKIKGKPIK